MVTEKRDGSVRGLREDGTNASFPQERIGRVYSPVYRLREEEIERGFEEIRERGRELAIPEPRLRDAYAEETDALKVLDDTIENLLPPHLRGAERRERALRCCGLCTKPPRITNVPRRIESLREEVWQPFEATREGVAVFGYLEYEAEKVTERGRWLADLHIDRPRLSAKRSKTGFSTLAPAQLAGIMAALTADEDRDYGELELEDDIVTSLSRFEDIGFKVSAEEWKHSVDPAPDRTFAAGAAVHWANGAPWSQIVKETRAEEGDLFRMFSRTGERRCCRWQVCAAAIRKRRKWRRRSRKRCCAIPSGKCRISHQQ